MIIAISADTSVQITKLFVRISEENRRFWRKKQNNVKQRMKL